MHYCTKIFTLLSVTLFTALAILSIDEKDEQLWVVIYGSTAAISGFSYFNRLHQLILITLITGNLAALLYLGPQLYKALTFIPDQGYVMKLQELKNITGLLLSLILLTHFLLIPQKNHLIGRSKKLK
ncbi:hypothetical protein [Xanthovirga aplysinae]|uniref:hypothetical protein n=1 Tax=Xanthovirga aplysinae TaxID=2529853 RepID=UPI0012BCDD10|nr:hypothetical protein [Xanthovirga aplysinae]MTI30380.1 hypothetical protein [Xanthovirga aplysinae]